MMNRIYYHFTRQPICALCEQPIPEGALFYKLDTLTQTQLDDGALTAPVVTLCRSLCHYCTISRLIGAVSSKVESEPSCRNEVHTVSLQKHLYLSNQCFHPLPFVVTTTNHHAFSKERPCDTVTMPLEPLPEPSSALA